MKKSTIRKMKIFKKDNDETPTPGNGNYIFCHPERKMFFEI